MCGRAKGRLRLVAYLWRFECGRGEVDGDLEEGVDRGWLGRRKARFELRGMAFSDVCVLWSLVKG